MSVKKDVSFGGPGRKQGMFSITAQRWRVSQSGRPVIAPLVLALPTLMLRVLLFLLACASAASVRPSSKPVLQPASMQKRIQTLLQSPSRSALADVLNGPYPPEARPAYQRAVLVTLIVAASYLIIPRSAIPRWVGAIGDYIVGRCASRFGICLCTLLCSMLYGSLIGVFCALIFNVIAVLLRAIFSNRPELQPVCVNQILHTHHLNQI